MASKIPSSDEGRRRYARNRRLRKKLGKIAVIVTSLVTAAVVFYASTAIA